MSTPITISVPHQLGRTGARRRIETGFTNIVQLLPGSAGTCTQRWEDNRLYFSLTSMGQTVTGVIDVLDAAVKMEIELLGVLGLMAGRLTDQFKKIGQLLLTKE